MNIYIPDKWVIIKLTSHVGTHYRVVGSWYGGYTSGDSWKISSGIEAAHYEDYKYIFPQTSSSIYHCDEDNYGMSFYTQEVLISYMNRADESGELEITLLSEEDALDYIEELLKES